MDQFKIKFVYNGETPEELAEMSRIVKAILEDQTIMERETFTKAFYDQVFSIQ